MRYTVALALVLVLLFLIPYARAVGITECGLLDTPNTEYEILNDIQSNGTCLNISGENISLNGNGMTINFSANSTAGHGIILKDSPGSVIESVSIRHLGNADNSHGILIENSESSAIRGSTIEAFYGSNMGISASVSAGLLVSNVTVNSSGHAVYISESPLSEVSDSRTESSVFKKSGTGMFFSLSPESKALRNSIKAYGKTISGPSGNGILFYECGGSQASGNTIEMHGYGSTGISIYHSDETVAINNTIQCFETHERGINLQDGSRLNVSGLEVVSYSSDSEGITVFNISDSNVSSCNILMSGYRSNGMEFGFNSHNISIHDCTINTTGDIGHGLFLSTFDRILLRSVNVFSGGQDANAMHIYDDGNTTLGSCILNSSYPGTADLHVGDGVSSGEWNLTNVTKAGGSNISAYWEPGSGGILNLFQLLVVKLMDRGLPLPGASVTVEGADISLSLETGDDGTAGPETLPMYSSEGGVELFSNNYTVEITKTGFTNLTFNLSLLTGMSVSYDFCGNGIIEGDEECDSGNVTETCESLGYDSGSISCSQTCGHDTSACHSDDGGNGDDGNGGNGPSPGPSGCATGQTRACSNDTGECTAGIQTCTSGVWGDCTGSMAAPELCDGKDNDCDGITDNNLTCDCFIGETKSCGSDIGECVAGTRTCTNGVWGDCEGGREPAIELCGNGKDDDCDGETDENCTTFQEAECEDGLIPDIGCYCGGVMHTSGYCYDGVFSEGPQGFPWYIIVIIGAAFLILAAILNHRRKQKKTQAQDIPVSPYPESAPSE